MREDKGRYTKLLLRSVDTIRDWVYLSSGRDQKINEIMKSQNLAFDRCNYRKYQRDLNIDLISEN